jgi:hypothetical protein
MASTDKDTHPTPKSDWRVDTYGTEQLVQPVSEETQDPLEKSRDIAFSLTKLLAGIAFAISGMLK